MKTNDALDDIDRHILRILSIYEGLNPVELWYELGECDPPLERVTQQEVAGRLESLQEIGLVERVPKAGEDVQWVVRGE